MSFAETLGTLNSNVSPNPNTTISTTTTPTVAATPTSSANTGSTGYTLPAGASDTGGGGASQAGNSANAAQIIGVGLNLGFAGYMASMCKPPNYMPCMMAAQGLMQALSTLGTAGSAKDAGSAMAANDAGYTPSSSGISPDALNDLSTDTGGGSGTTGTTGTGSLASQLGDLKSQLATTGTKISPDGSTITLPDGRTVSSGTGSSAGDLASAGFSQGEIDQGMAAVAGANASLKDKIQAMKVAAGGADGGGGGGAPGGPGGEGSGRDIGAMMRALASKNEKRKGSVVGMSKKLGTDNIGVAGDNIFEMISRRYKARDQQNSFLH